MFSSLLSLFTHAVDARYVSFSVKITATLKNMASASKTIHFQNGTIINANNSIVRPLQIVKQGRDLTVALAEDIAEEMADDPSFKVSPSFCSLSDLILDSLPSYSSTSPLRDPAGIRFQGINSSFDIEYNYDIEYNFLQFLY